MAPSNRWRFFLFFTWISLLIAAQILLFTNGFLLSRVALFENATCINSTDSCDITGCPDLFNDNTLCSKQRSSKVILLIIDAFRYDFALYNDSISNPLPYQNKLSIISTLLQSHANHARLYKFIADPPTTTMQRIKGLTTGSLPTFIDAGSNFATNEINEDNVIDQLISSGRKVIFMGDDTWNGLYPNRFLRNYPYPSFNVWDLDTVDEGVKANLFPEMKKSDWSLLIGHFLGVDHCGHRYGPDHPEMERKLTEMDHVIRKVVDTIDDDTILFVVGDHGMTSTGDHGGETENEVSATMFVYSKQELSPKYFANNNTVKQVDIVPTLSTILGIPVPFSNLGGVVYDLLPIVYTDTVPGWHHDMYATRSNVRQITKYLETYSRDGSFDSDKLETILARYHNLEKTPVVDKKDFVRFARDANDLIKSAREMCEEVWIQFDAYSMARGLLLISHIAVFLFLLVEGLSVDELDRILSRNFVTACYCSTVLLAPTLTIALYFCNVVDDIANTLYFVAGLASVVLTSVSCVRNFQTISACLYDNGKNRRWPQVVSRVILMFSSVMLLSNSFILEEAKVMLFFLLTLVLLIILEYYGNRTSHAKELSFRSLIKSKIILFGLFVSVLIRLSVYFWRCREEEFGCGGSVYSKGHDRFEWIVALVSLSLFVTLSRTWLKSCGNLNGSSMTVILARHAPTVMVVCTCGFWVLHALPTDTKIKLIGPWQPDMLVWVIYALIALGLIGIVVQPLCIYRLSNNKVEFDARAPNLIPQLAKYILNDKYIEQSKEKRVPVIFGLATVYTSAIIIISIYFTLLWALLLGQFAATSAIALVIAMALILVVISIARYENVKKIEDLLEASSTSVIIWFLLSVYLFYGTGHQPTFNTIAWEAAFTGTGGFFKSNAIPATLVLINTFGSYIIAGFSLPLLLVAPIGLYLMLPTLSGKKLKLDLSQGEMVLYDRETLMLGNVFKLSCRYILCHVLRVFCSMLAATIHCRHLMVWNIFAPKLIFESIALFTTLLSVSLGFLLVVHVTSKLDRFVKALTKQCS